MCKMNIALKRTLAVLIFLPLIFGMMFTTALGMEPDEDTVTVAQAEESIGGQPANEIPVPPNEEEPGTDEERDSDSEGPDHGGGPPASSNKDGEDGEEPGPDAEPGEDETGAKAGAQVDAQSGGIVVKDFKLLDASETEIEDGATLPKDSRIGFVINWELPRLAGDTMYPAGQAFTIDLPKTGIRFSESVTVKLYDTANPTNLLGNWYIKDNQIIFTLEKNVHELINGEFSFWAVITSRDDKLVTIDTRANAGPTLEATNKRTEEPGEVLLRKTDEDSGEPIQDAHFVL